MNLIEAAYIGNINVVRFLITQGVDVNQIGVHKLTALMIAVRKDHDEVVELLLEYGANVDQANQIGITALMTAIENGNDKVVKLLLKHGANVDQVTRKGKTALMIAVENGHYKIIKLLLDKGANANHINNEGLTPLIWAVQDGDCKIVKVLLDHGVNINYVNSEGWTALMLGAEKGYVELIELLLEKGANIDQTAIDGNTALMIGAYNKQIKIVRFLISKGANIDKTNKQGWTALMLAAGKGHYSIIGLLLDRGASFDQANQEGGTALIFAAQNGHEEVIKLLLAKKAKIDQANQKDLTALIFASYYGHDKVVNLLLDKGADPNKKAQGLKALDQAFSQSHYHVVKQFLIMGAFTTNDMSQIKEHIDKILDTSSQAEKITVLANLIDTVDQEDTEFIQDVVKVLNSEIVKIHTIIDTKNFRVKEKIDLCEKLQALKAKTKVIDLTQEVLEGLWNKVDDKLIVELKVSYDKISDVWGRYISKEKLTKDPAQKIASYFETDDDLANLCEAVPYKYAMKILKPTSQKVAVVESQADEGLVDGGIAVLGAEENLEELPA